MKNTWTDISFISFIEKIQQKDFLNFYLHDFFFNSNFEISTWIKYRIMNNSINFTIKFDTDIMFD